MAQTALNTVATARATIDAPADRVWQALTTPEEIKRYMFGTTVATDWRPGSPITWTGEWKGKHYEDRGRILLVEPRRQLRYSHYSPLSGKPDTPENHHTVTVDLEEQDGRTRVTFTQDNNATEEARVHAEENWRTVLDGLKQMLETGLNAAASRPR
jgi:uncharacterized protein YndB with AHSA1/START domain